MRRRRNPDWKLTDDQLYRALRFNVKLVEEGDPAGEADWEQLPFLIEDGRQLADSTREKVERWAIGYTTVLNGRRSISLKEKKPPRSFRGEGRVFWTGTGRRKG